MGQAVETESQVGPPAICYLCGRTIRQGWGFAFKTDQVSAVEDDEPSLTQGSKCIRCALRHTPMLKRSFLVAVVVGTILTLLNQGDTMFAGDWKDSYYWKVPLTFCVPFCVATYGALTNSRR